MAIDLWSLLLSAKETHRKAQKLTECYYTDVILLFAFLGLKHASSVLGMARLQHGFGSLYQSKLGQHGMVRLGIMLARFGHVYTATANRAEPCWHGFKWQCKCSIR